MIETPEQLKDEMRKKLEADGPKKLIDDTMRTVKLRAIEKGVPVKDADSFTRWTFTIVDTMVTLIEEKNAEEDIV